MTIVTNSTNPQVDTVAYNKELGFMVEILETGDKAYPYVLEYSRASNDYRTEFKEYAHNLGCACVMARFFCDNGKRL